MNNSSVFAATSNIPPNTSLHQLSQPILSAALSLITNENFHRMPWADLKTVEFELRLGQFVSWPKQDNQQSFRGGGGRGRGQFGPRGGGGGGQSGTDQQSAERWTATLGFLPQTTPLGPKKFKANMFIPSRELFDRATHLADSHCAAAASSTAPFTVTGSKKTTQTCDYQFPNAEDARVTIDLATKLPSNAVNKKKLSPADFGVAASPVDVRFALSKETPLADNDREGSNQASAVSFVLNKFFGAAAAGPTTTTSTRAQNPSIFDRCDQRKKDRTSYSFTITPNFANHQAMPKEEDHNEKSSQTLLMMQQFFPVGGVNVDLTRVIMNGKNETLEAELEWDLAAAIDALSTKNQAVAADAKKDNDKSAALPTEVLTLMQRVRDAFLGTGAGETEQTKSEQTKARDELRLTFLMFGLGAVARSALGLALSLDSDGNDNTSVGVAPRTEGFAK